MLINVHFHIPKSLHTKFGKNDPVLSARIRFSFSYVNDLGPRSKMTSGDFEKSYTFIYSVSCLHLPTFCSQTVVVSEKYTVFSFSYRNA